MSLVDNLIKEGWLKTPTIIEAFKTIQRADFMTEDMKGLSQMNEALPIGYGQTISQPLVVAFMLELLQPNRGDKILDVGSGSGWTTALLSHIVGDSALPAGRPGRVIAIETIKELKYFGENNTAKYNFVEKGIAKFLWADATKGYKKEAPYDKILASASADSVPLVWKEQLKVGGRMALPLRNSIWLFVKKAEDEFEEEEHPGFAFVPLIEK